MIEKDLIRKIQLLKNIKPDQNWVSFCRQNILNQLTTSNRQLTTDNLQQTTDNRFTFGFNWLFNLRLSPARAIAPLFLVLAVVLAGFVFNVGQINEEQGLNSVVVLSDKPSDKSAVSDEADKTDNPDKSDKVGMPVKSDKKPSSFAGNISNGVKGIIDKVKTVTLGEGDQLALKEETEAKIEELKKQVEELFMGTSEEIALAEQAVLVLKKAEDFLDQGDIISAFEEAVAAERLLDR